MSLDMSAPAMGSLAGALAKAQAQFPSIPRDREVTVQMKTGGSYKFKYAPLDTILSAVRKPLSDNGLAITQLLDGTDLVTVLLHESGGTLEGRWPIPHNNGDTVQNLGSAITYLRRYALQAILGIASEEDDDGNAASGNHATPTARQPRAAAPAQPPRPVAVPSAPQADVANLHAQFADPDEEAAEAYAASKNGFANLPDNLTGMSAAELFARAEEAGITKAMLTVSAKTMFGPNRWKVTDLTDDERAALWEETAAVPA